MPSKCQWCGGRGIVQCGECDGFGYIIHVEYEDEDDELGEETYEDCYGCGGTGEVECMGCGGLG